MVAVSLYWPGGPPPRRCIRRSLSGLSGPKPVTFVTWTTPSLKPSIKGLVGLKFGSVMPCPTPALSRLWPYYDGWAVLRSSAVGYHQRSFPVRTHTGTAYCLSSLPAHAQRILDATRAH